MGSTGLWEGEVQVAAVWRSETFAMSSADGFEILVETLVPRGTCAGFMAQKGHSHHTANLAALPLRRSSTCKSSTGAANLRNGYASGERRLGGEGPPEWI